MASISISTATDIPISIFVSSVSLCGWVMITAWNSCLIGARMSYLFYEYGFRCARPTITFYPEIGKWGSGFPKVKSVLRTTKISQGLEDKSKGTWTYCNRSPGFALERLASFSSIRPIISIEETWNRPIGSGSIRRARADLYRWANIRLCTQMSTTICRSPS